MDGTELSKLIRDLLPAEEEIRKGNYQKAILDIISVLAPVLGLGGVMIESDPTLQIISVAAGALIGAFAKWWSINSNAGVSAVYGKLYELADYLDDEYFNDKILPDQPTNQFAVFPGVIYMNENGVDKAFMDVPVAKAAGLKQVDDANFVDCIPVINRATGRQELQGYWNPFKAEMHNMIGLKDCFADQNAGPSVADLIASVRADAYPLRKALALCGNPMLMKYRIIFATNAETEFAKLNSTDPTTKKDAMDYAYNATASVGGVLYVPIEMGIDNLGKNMPRDLVESVAVAAFSEFYK